MNVLYLKDGGAKTLSTVENSSSSNVFRISLDNRLSVTLPKDCEVKTVEGFKRVNELTLDDKLVRNKLKSDKSINAPLEGYLLGLINLFPISKVGRAAQLRILNDEIEKDGEFVNSFLNSVGEYKLLDEWSFCQRYEVKKDDIQLKNFILDDYSLIWRGDEETLKRLEQATLNNVILSPRKLDENNFKVSDVDIYDRQILFLESLGYGIKKSGGEVEITKGGFKDTIDIKSILNTHSYDLVTEYPSSGVLNGVEYRLL